MRLDGATLTGQELKAVKEVINDGLAGTRITEWEREFLTNMQKRSDGKASVYFTDNQLGTIERIEHKVYGT